MTILFLLRLWPVFGGGEAMTRLWANEFVKRGFNVHVLYFKHTEYGTKPFIDGRIKQHLMSGGICDEFTKNDVEDTYNVCKKICEIIKTESIDVVINQWLPKSFIKNIKRDTDAKVIWCLRTMLAQPYEKPKTFKRWVKYTLFPWHYKNRIKYNAVSTVEDVLPLVDKYVFLSNAYLNQYLSWSKNPIKEKVIAIPNPLPPAQFSISEDEIHEKENIVLVVGRMKEVCKQFSLVLRVWKIIEDSFNLKDDAWRIVLVGDGENLVDYKQMASDLKLKHITFEGFKEPQPYYSKAKIFLMTSRVEGFGNVLLEAQQMGVVPIAMDSYPAVRDIIIDGYNGIIVPKNNIRRMANALMKLMVDEKQLKMLRKNGISYMQNFSFEKVYNQWSELLNSL